MIEIELQIHIRRNGKPFLTTMSARFLEEVDKRGSVRIAARELKYSYQHAWDIVEGVNRAASEPLVIKQRGGAGGGGARLSTHGRNILGEFRTIQGAVGKFTKKLNAEIAM